MAIALPDEAVRLAAFAHLDRLLAGDLDRELRSEEINTFVFDGRPVRLVVQTGIWKPAGLDAALSIRTAYTAPDQTPPYLDGVGADGLVHYAYRGSDPEHSDNRALRVALGRGAPLAYFIGVGRGVYQAHYPVWVVGEDVAALEFAVAVDEGQRFIDPTVPAELQRAYRERLTRLRLHQPIFRARVLHAYGEACAMCRLRHRALLDAAHILPDVNPRGTPIVPNGLSLCKIHHAAYDRNILGVRPDLVVEVAPAVLAEVDGPMLRHGLQEMAGVRLTVPRGRAERPDPTRLEERYEEFRRAG